jgi:hypothetical protein
MDEGLDAGSLVSHPIKAVSVLKKSVTLAPKALVALPCLFYVCGGQARTLTRARRRRHFSQTYGFCWTRWDSVPINRLPNCSIGIPS